MFSKVVSTLLEILRETAGAGASPGSTSRVSTLLEILPGSGHNPRRIHPVGVSTLLEILDIIQKVIFAIMG